MLQPRFERRASSSAPTLLEQPRFRAGLDFLRLRGEVGEADPTLAAWWEALYQASDEQRRDILDGVREQRGPRRVKRASARDAGDGSDSNADTAVDARSGAETVPPDRRRRRRAGRRCRGAAQAPAPAQEAERVGRLAFVTSGDGRARCGAGASPRGLRRPRLEPRRSSGGARHRAGRAGRVAGDDARGAVLVLRVGAGRCARRRLPQCGRAARHRADAAGAAARRCRRSSRSKAASARTATRRERSISTCCSTARSRSTAPS